MKISAVLPFLLILLFSCAQENKNIGCEKLYESKNLWLLNNIPYTGICENHENGILEYYSEFEGGLMKRTTQVYPNGQPEEIVEWNNGKPNGQVKYFHKNGQISLEGQLVNDSKEGIWKTYYQSGQLESVENWKENQMQDSVFGYFENGNLEIIGFFLNDKQDGRWIMYDSANGEVDGYLYYNNGKVINGKEK
jgi:antitoxin component YwqK of YwqJK toxin-antitoxin module